MIIISIASFRSNPIFELASELRRNISSRKPVTSSVSRDSRLSSSTFHSAPSTVNYRLSLPPISFPESMNESTAAEAGTTTATATAAV